MQQFELKYKEGVDFSYDVQTSDGKVQLPFKLLKGPYKDVVYQYGKVVVEEAPDGNAYLKFVYNVLQSPIEKLDDDLDFKNHIGEILVSILQHNLNQEQANANRNDDIEELDTE